VPACGRIVTSIARGHGVPLQDGPPAPALPEGAWHDLDGLPAQALRRVRAMDVTAVRDELVVDAWFRDTYGELDGRQSVLHEYTLSAWVDRAATTLLELSVTPRVLPAEDCPRAVDEVGRLVGTGLTGLRGAVRGRLGGTDGCTHLNDLLGCLAWVPALAADLADASGGARPPIPRRVGEV
jgi:hypothetical protein